MATFGGVFGLAFGIEGVWADRSLEERMRHRQLARLGTPWSGSGVLMIGFETPLTRALGVACLFAFVAAGLFLIVDPVLLADEADPDVDRFAHGPISMRPRHRQEGPGCPRS